MTGRPNHSEIWDGVAVGWSITAYLLAGLLVGWAVGFGIDRLAGTPKVFTAIGMIAGVAIGIYLVYVHYGREHDDTR